MEIDPCVSPAPCLASVLRALNSIASHADNESRRAAALRRIAIVLRDLPASVARQLLDELSPEARHRVKHEIANLVDVDPMERRRALESFAGSMRRGAARQSDSAGAPADVADEIQISHAAHRASESRPATARASSPALPASLEFFDSVSDDELLSLLREEHPQTQAVVLAQIQPARAAALLPRLGGAQRQDLLARIGRLQALPDEMLTEIANSFRQRVDRLLAARTPNPLQSLVAAMGGGDSAYSASAAQHVPAAAVAVSPRLQAILAEMPASPPRADDAPTARAAAAGRPHHVSDSLARVHTDDAAENAAERLRRITRDDLAPPTTASQPRSETRANLSTDEIHQELIRMPPRRLCETLAQVSTRTAILTLCGLPNKVADAAIACLPRAQANQVRRQLMTVGSLEMREIDQAKEQVVVAARVGGRVPVAAEPTVSQVVRSSPVAVAMS